MTLTIRSATDGDIPDAFRDMFADGELDPRGLIVATDGEAIRGTIFAYRIGGAQAAIWPPNADDADVRDALVAGALAWIHGEPTRTVQAVVRDSDLPRTDALVRAGFRRVTRLANLSRASSPTDAAFAPNRMTFESVSVPSAEFAATMQRTYEGTLDVPELNGTRTIDEVVAGYREAQSCESSRWWLLRERGAPVGVVMLAEQSDGSTIELTYVGLIPPARGHGLGREAIGFALARAAESGSSRVTLTVDVRNAPALRRYDEWHFRRDDERTAFLRLSK